MLLTLPTVSHDWTYDVNKRSVRHKSQNSLSLLNRLRASLSVGPGGRSSDAFGVLLKAVQFEDRRKGMVPPESSVIVNLQGLRFGAGLIAPVGRVDGQGPRLR